MNQFIKKKKMKKNLNPSKLFSRISISFSMLVISFGMNAQTNVFDNVIAVSPNHTYLEAALLQQGLDVALKNNAATLTVFAPDDNAFLALATALGTNITGLLALPNLTDILTYHVLGTTVPASAVTNGAIVQPLSTTNTLKLTKTAGGSVYANQAKVTTADLTASNGVVHVLNGVLLPFETVADVAIDNGFSTLVTAVVTAELLPAVTNPFATLTVFAPTNAAFDNLATSLGTNVNGLLALPNLADVLTYHVLGTEVPSSAVTNGAIVQPLSTTNTLKLTVTLTGDVYVNQAKVTAVDINATNGVVHVLNAVVLPVETVVDVAIDNGFTSLTAAVVKAELLPALTNPFGTFTVFAPTNTAFDNLATALGVDLNGVLAHPQLGDILLYHVLGSEVLSTQLVNGAVATLNGQNVTIDLTAGVKVNASNVTLADVLAFNGVVHVIDAVLLPSLASIFDNEISDLTVYPNPTAETIFVKNSDATEYAIVNAIGAIVQSGKIINNEISVSELQNGQYFIQITTNNNVSSTTKFVKQ
jgi:transforming growth factor-beta-induced protein